MEKEPKALTSEAQDTATSQRVLAAIRGRTGKEQVVHQNSTRSLAQLTLPLAPSDGCLF